MLVGDLNEESLKDLFSKAQENIRNIENPDDRTSQKYKDLILKTLETVEKVSILVSSLRLFSTNEDLDDVSTENLR